MCSHLFPSARPNIDLLQERIEQSKNESVLHVTKVGILPDILKTNSMQYDDLKRVYERLKLVADEVYSEDHKQQSLFSWSNIRHELLDTHKDLLER